MTAGIESGKHSLGTKPLSWPDWWHKKNPLDKFLMWTPFIGPQVEAMRAIQEQLDAREPSCMELWGCEPRRLAIVSRLLEILTRNLSWANDLFIPDDPMEIVLFNAKDWDGMDCASLIIIIEDDFRAKIPEDLHKWTLGELVEHLDKARNREFDFDESVFIQGALPLHEAAGAGRTEAVEQLLDAGANPDAKTTMGYTPLHWTARAGHVEVAKRLLERGASINATGLDGLTPLHLAAFLGHRELLRLLLARGGDVKAKTRLGTTPLDAAASGGVRDLFEK